jgi:hypothetical protein
MLHCYRFVADQNCQQHTSDFFIGAELDCRCRFDVQRLRMRSLTCCCGIELVELPIHSIVSEIEGATK